MCLRLSGGQCAIRSVYFRVWPRWYWRLLFAHCRLFLWGSSWTTRKNHLEKAENQEPSWIMFSRFVPTGVVPERKGEVPAEHLEAAGRHVPARGKEPRRQLEDERLPGQWHEPRLEISSSLRHQLQPVSLWSPELQHGMRVHGPPASGALASAPRSGAQ